MPRASSSLSAASSRASRALVAEADDRPPVLLSDVPCRPCAAASSPRSAWFSARSAEMHCTEGSLEGVDPVHGSSGSGRCSRSAYSGACVTTRYRLPVTPPPLLLCTCAAPSRACLRVLSASRSLVVSKSRVTLLDRPRRPARSMAQKAGSFLGAPIFAVSSSTSGGDGRGVNRGAVKLNEQHHRCGESGRGKRTSGRKVGAPQLIVTESLAHDAQGGASSCVLTRQLHCKLLATERPRRLRVKDSAQPVRGVHASALHRKSASKRVRTPSQRSRQPVAPQPCRS
jgi:hypothetical protein